jgi:hypothetical protein
MTFISVNNICRYFEKKNISKSAVRESNLVSNYVNYGYNIERMVYVFLANPVHVNITGNSMRGSEIASEITLII